jgi:hypothetical protein
VARFSLLARAFPAALAATALAPAAAHAWMPEPVEVTKSVSLDPGDRTAEVRTRRRFDLAGLEWRGASRVHAELRVPARDGGGWTSWGHSDAGHDGPDGGREARAGLTVGNPVWTGGSRRVQIRLSRPVRGLRLRLVNTTGSATPAVRAKTRAKVARKGAFGSAAGLPSTNVGTPAIVPRSSWGASRCRPRTSPAYGSVKAAYVHHTVSLNGYSASRSASMVLGICLFHRNGNGWNDIGYGFLVDRFGRVFEGRAGGLDAPVVGAHAGGFNSESAGIAVLGNFTFSAPPRAAMDSLARVLAWKLSVHGVPARGRVTVTSLGGPSARYRYGRRVKVNRISGHRDVDLTSCPGGALYARLPALRRRVARLQAGVSRLDMAAAAGEVPYGSGVRVDGRLSVPEGTTPDGAQVELRRFDRGRETLLMTATAGPDGAWSADLPPLERSQFVRAVFAGDDGRPGVVSGLAYVAVLPQIELSVAPELTTAGSAVRASGAVRPGKRRVRITASRQAPDGSESPALSRRVSARDGAYDAALALDEPGTYRVVTTAKADSRSLAGSSRSVTVHVLPTP